jgi:hypothetical protein
VRAPFNLRVHEGDTVIRAKFGSILFSVLNRKNHTLSRSRRKSDDGRTDLDLGFRRDPQYSKRTLSEVMLAGT